MTEAEALDLLQKPEFGNPLHIEASKIITAIVEVDQAIKNCPHYAEWEYSCSPCCSLMHHLAWKYPEIFNERLNLRYGTTGSGHNCTGNYIDDSLEF